MKHFIFGLIISLLLISFSPLSRANITPFDAFTFHSSSANNPGALSASYYLARNSNQGKVKKTIVLLHGCGQNAEQLAIDSGFLALAKQHQFNLLLPQQSEKNNIKQCFNWFSKQDMTRDSGELVSLKNMINTMKQQTDSQQVYLVGLSAGGAMASALLSIYPQLFSAGAIIAGIPYPCADTLTKAIACMRTGPSQNPQQLAQAVIAEHKQPINYWPPLSIWTGSNDRIVSPKNSQLIAQKWLKLMQVKSKPQVVKHQHYQQSQWQNPQGQVMVELIEINDLGHGIMVNPNEQNGGVEGPFLLKSSISTAKKLLQFWKIDKN